MTRSTTTLCVVALCWSSASAFSVPYLLPSRAVGVSTTQLRMGLFDGVKDAFSAPALERSTLDSERETPIDRWMGWSVAKDNQQQTPNGTLDEVISSSSRPVGDRIPLEINFCNGYRFGGTP
jgi:hypothetical protein